MKPTAQIMELLPCVDLFPEGAPKDPRSYIFPEQRPNNCSRNCTRFFSSHTKTISFALYATKNPNLDPSTICAYAFSCGQDVESYHFRLTEGEMPADLVRRVVPELIGLFLELAKAEREQEEIKDN